MSQWPGILNHPHNIQYDLESFMSGMKFKNRQEMINKIIDAPSCVREWYCETLDLRTTDGLYKDGYLRGFFDGDKTHNKDFFMERPWMLGFVDGKGDRESSVLR